MQKWGIRITMYPEAFHICIPIVSLDIGVSPSCHLKGKAGGSQLQPCEPIASSLYLSGSLQRVNKNHICTSSGTDDGGVGIVHWTSLIAPLFLCPHPASCCHLEVCHFQLDHSLLLCVLSRNSTDWLVASHIGEGMTSKAVFARG